MSDKRKNSKKDPEQEHTISEKHMGFFEKYVPHSHVSSAVATVFLVVVGIWGVIETRHALKLSERAWLSPIAAIVSAPIEEGKDLRFNIMFMNVGKEPAVSTTYAWQNGTVKAPPADDWSSLIVGENTSCDGLRPQKGSHAILPSLNGLGTLRAFDSEDGKDPLVVSKAIVDGTLHYYVRGCIAYETFEESHTTSFCYVLQTRAGVDYKKTPFLECPTGFEVN